MYKKHLRGSQRDKFIYFKDNESKFVVCESISLDVNKYIYITSLVTASLC
jgi:hypothetical protein